MQLSSTMREDEIRAALDQAALQTWGPERFEPLQRVLDGTARMIHLVLQAPLAPLDEGPDFPKSIHQVGTES
jgi:hypothetical protein